jgi:hypothetical protein
MTPVNGVDIEYVFAKHSRFIDISAKNLLTISVVAFVNKAGKLTILTHVKK